MRTFIILHIALQFIVQYNTYYGGGGYERENFPQYYTILFNGIADALKALDQQETSRAWDILVRIQQEAEDAYIRAEET